MTDFQIADRRLLQPRLFRSPDSHDETTPQSSRLVRHRKRPEWGAAICAWARHERQAYQFEDGKLRTFPSTHLHLLEPVERPPAEAMATIRALRAASGLNVARRNRKRGEEIQMTFDQQLLLFKHLYPDGFDGEPWKADHRGGEGKRSLKRHRDPAIAKAAELLAEDELTRLHEARRSDEIVTRLVDVLSATDVVTKRHVDPLRKLGSNEAGLVADAVVDLLYGNGSLRHRLDSWAKRLRQVTGRAPSWPLVTAPLALRYPGEHVCVRASTFRQQVKTAGDGASPPRAFDARQYERLLFMARDVADRLAAAGYTPVDMLDIYDFIWVTLRPAARDKLAELEVGPVSSTQLTKQDSDDATADAA